jgi:hypothetical protein
VEPFWLEQVRRLERDGVPYAGERFKWWYSTVEGWVLTWL